MVAVAVEVAGAASRRESQEPMPQSGSRSTRPLLRGRGAGARRGCCCCLPVSLLLRPQSSVAVEFGKVPMIARRWSSRAPRVWGVPPGCPPVASAMPAGCGRSNPKASCGCSRCYFGGGEAARGTSRSRLARPAGSAWGCRQACQKRKTWRGHGDPAWRTHCRGCAAGGATMVVLCAPRGKSRVAAAVVAVRPKGVAKAKSQCLKWGTLNSAT